MITEEFLLKLSSKDPVPGGGGVAALTGSLAASLGSMVGNLTSGKKKYAEYQEDIERLIDESISLRDSLFEFIEKDAVAFEPLSKAYGIPKDDPKRDRILEKALFDAATAPYELIETLYSLTDVLEELSVKGSRLAISDVGVAASLLGAAAKSAILNVYINTGLMKEEKTALMLNEKSKKLVDDIEKRCEIIYSEISNSLKKN